MSLRLPLLLISLFASAAGPALAGGSIDKLTVTPASGVRAGETVTVEVALSGAEDGICGIEVELGDGRREEIKVKPNTPLPIRLEHRYKAAGEYKIRAAGDKVENAFGCNGKQIAMIKVSAGGQSAGANVCPADWSVKGKVAANGAYTCVPAKGAKNPAKPEKGLNCPVGTSYFTKGKTLGCEAN